MSERHEDRAILEQVITYYEQKLEQYGKTPRGVDWNSSEGQELRFRQLCKLLPSNGVCSVLDYGCGYGALCSHLKAHYNSISYIGFDISEMMIEAAKQAVPPDISTEFHSSLPPGLLADYALASGLFNVKQDCTEADWIDYCIRVMDKLNELSVCGFGMNFLTSYSDAAHKRQDLYYADPSLIVKLCMERYSRKVSLLHDYPLYEFTILIRKDQ